MYYTDLVKQVAYPKHCLDFDLGCGISIAPLICLYQMLYIMYGLIFETKIRMRQWATSQTFLHPVNIRK